MSKYYKPKAKPVIPDLEGEIWGEVYDYPNYLVSNMGRVKNIRRGNLVKPCDDGAGYDVVYLFTNKKKYCKRVARLVWNTFNNCNCDLTIDHINQQKKDNRLSNLRCVSSEVQAENRTLPKIKNKYNLTNEIRGIIAKGLLDGTMTTWTIMKQYGLPLKYTRSVRQRGSWNKYIPDETV
jgi:hypothetical protein